jgi:hypothetical protein
MAAESRAHQLVEEARKKLKPSFFSFLSNKTEEAAELLEKAAGQFKIAKLCERSCFCGLVLRSHRVQGTKLPRPM